MNDISKYIRGTLQLFCHYIILAIRTFTFINKMKKDVQKQNITDDENKDYGVSDQEIIRIAR